MKALRIYGELDMRLEDVSIPEINDDQVLVKVSAVGICTTDIELYDGSMSYFNQGLSKRPMIPGHEWSGFISKIGKNVKNLKKGDLVVGDISIGCGKCHNCLKGAYNLCDNRTELGVMKYDGAFAEYLKTDGKNVYKVPRNITPEEAALVEPTATVTYAVRKTGIEPGALVTIFGDGTIGLLNAQVAKACGASSVVVVARKSVHSEKVKKWGIKLINSNEIDVVGGIKKCFGSLSDIVFECTGNADAFESAVRSVKPGGKICALSITGRPAIPVDMDYIVTRDITVVGVLASPNSFDPALKLIASRKIDVRSCISHRYPFEKSLEAFDFVRNSSGKDRIKVLVILEWPI